jgi:hypothetical protein
VDLKSLNFVKFTITAYLQDSDGEGVRGGMVGQTNQELTKLFL